MTLPPVYATREDVMRALDVQPTARMARQIDRALQSASRSVDALCHRRFYPETATRSWDWPDSQQRPSWRLWLDASEVISVTTLTTGGQTIAASDYLLEPNRSGPPYNRLEIDLDGSAAFGGGDTHQRDVTITGLWGYRNDETQVGTLTAAVATTTATSITVDAPASAELGIGSVLRLGSERLLVTARTMGDTGQNVGGAGLTAQANSVALTVSDGSVFAVDETLLIDSERVLIVDIAGNTLTVNRAVDGSVLAAHAAGADIYAARTFTVTRGALGTTAATHLSGATVVRWDPPGLVRDLTIADAMNRLTNEQAGYVRTRRTTSGSGSSSDQALVARDLPALRTQTYQAHGRKARTRGV